MPDEHQNPDAKLFIEKIEDVERQATEYAGFIKKLKMWLSRTKKALATKPAVASQVSALVADLQAMIAEPARPAVSHLAGSLEGQLHSLRRSFQEGFPAALLHGCESAGIDFKGLSDGFGVGPFLVVVDNKKEAASFQYAKLPVLKDVPLNVQAIVSHATNLKASLIDPPVDFPRFRSELHEAIRVATARREHRQPAGELRVDLPAVFREMGFIRNPSGGGTRKKTGATDYPLSRFVVELKQFMQSNENLHADQQFRLEPAVIENTKNPKKSVFVPRDISCGFGEGTYYQAVVLQQK